MPRCPGVLLASVCDGMCLLSATVLGGFNSSVMVTVLAWHGQKSWKQDCLPELYYRSISWLCKKMESSLAIVEAISATALGICFHLNVSAFTAPSDSSEIIFALTYKRNLGGSSVFEVVFTQCFTYHFTALFIISAPVVTPTLNSSMKLGVIIHQESSLP